MKKNAQFDKTNVQIDRKLKKNVQVHNKINRMFMLNLKRMFMLKKKTEINVQVDKKLKKIVQVERVFRLTHWRSEIVRCQLGGLTRTIMG